MDLRDAMATILDEKDARIAELESALAKAEEALVCATWLIPPIGHTEDALHQVGVLVNEALAAIKEARND